MKGGRAEGDGGEKKEKILRRKEGEKFEKKRRRKIGEEKKT